MFNPGIVAHRKRTGGSLILKGVTTVRGFNYSGDISIDAPPNSAGDLIIIGAATRNRFNAVTSTGFSVIAEIGALSAPDSAGRSTALEKIAGTNEPSSYVITAGGGNNQYMSAACYCFTTYGLRTGRTSRKKNVQECSSPSVNFTLDDVYALSIVTKAEWCYNTIIPPTGITKDEAIDDMNQALAVGHGYFPNATSVGVFDWSNCSGSTDYTTGVTVIIRKE